MAIAQLTHLHISIPASGSTPGAVLEECVGGPSRVSFASEKTVLGVVPDSEQSPDRVPVDLPAIQMHDPVCPGIPEEDTMDVSIEVSDVHIPVLPPPPGFERFIWAMVAGGPGGDPSLFDFWDLLDHLVIRRRCRFLQFLVLPRTTRLLTIWALPEMSQIHHPGLIACRTLLWDLHHPMYHDRY